MARYPDMRELSRFATEDYSRIDGLDQIRPPYPAQGTPNWWALRMKYEQLLFARIRKERSGSPLKCTVDDSDANAAKWAALGNETADRDYQGAVPTAFEVHERQKRPDWLALQAKAAAAVGRI